MGDFFSGQIYRKKITIIHNDLCQAYVYIVVGQLQIRLSEVYFTKGERDDEDNSL